MLPDDLTYITKCIRCSTMIATVIWIWFTH